MRFFCVVGAILYGVLAASPGVGQIAVTAKDVSPVEQALISSEQSLIAAKKKDDAAFFTRTLAPDFTLVGVDGQLHKMPEAANELGDSELLELAPYDMNVVTLGEEAAIVTYDAILRKAPEEDQGAPPRYQHFTSVWVKQGEQWRLKFHQSTASHWGDW